MGLKLEGITKSWPSFALKDINLTVEDAEHFFILGPTGAGKTLLLETIMGFHKPKEGRIILDGNDITNVPPEKRGIGYVSQNCVLFPHMTVRQNIEFGLKIRKTTRETRDKIINEVLNRVGLEGLENRRPEGLSGGERQKVALARVMVLQLKTILLDEPLTALDTETASQLKNQLKQIHKEGKTIIQVSHNQLEAFSLGDRMAVLNHGCIMQVGKVREIFLNPKNEFVARFLGYENIYKAQLVREENNYSLLRIGAVTLKIRGQITQNECVVGIRPEDIEIVSSAVNHYDTNMISGSVIDWADMGPVVSVTCDVGFTVKVVLTKSSFIDKNIEVGRTVQVAFKAESLKPIL